VRPARAVAPARPPRSPRPAARRVATGLAAALLFPSLAEPAAAQLAGSIGVQNTYRLRGYSISGGHPVATLDLYYDHPSGIYLNASGLGELGHDANPEFLGYIVNIGYARRVGRQLSLDGGVVRTQFSHYAAGRSAGAHYTEIYAGLAGRGLSAHLHYSPDYYRRGASTLYGEIDGALKPAENWQLSAHVGLLGYLDYPGAPTIRYRPRSVQYDWRIGAARQFGAVSLHADVSGGGPGAASPYRASAYRYARHQGTALTVGANWVF